MILNHEYPWSLFSEFRANSTQEIALVLKWNTERFSSQWPLDDILSGFEFSLAVGTNYFMEIAKIRAFRILFYHILKLYSASDLKSGQYKDHCNQLT